LVAEVIRHYFPHLIDIHNYTSSTSSKQKKDNWFTLKKKVFSRLEFDVPEAIVTDLCNGKPGTVEILLYNLRIKINEEVELRKNVPKRHLPSAGHALLPLTAVNPKRKGEPLFSTRSNLTSKSTNNLSNQWVPRSDFDQLKQQCDRQQEQLGLLQTKTRRLEHVVQLVDIRVNEFSSGILDKQHTKQQKK
jgi:hypothetical protein